MIRELRAQGYAVPNFPEKSQSDGEKYKARYAKVSAGCESRCANKDAPWPHQ